MKERRFAVLREIAEHGVTATWAISLALDLPFSKIAHETGALRRTSAIRMAGAEWYHGRLFRRWEIAGPSSPIAYRLASERGAPGPGSVVLAYDDWPRPVLSVVDHVLDDRFYVRPVVDGERWRHAAWRVVPVR